MDGANKQQLILNITAKLIKKLVDVMITIDEKLCKGCNICTEFCPQKVYQESKTLNKKGVHVPQPKNEDRCRQCQLCTLMCPDQAIKVDEKDEN